MGLQGLENVKIYDDEPKKTDNKAEKTKTPEVTEADYLFDKTYKFAKRNLKPKWLEQVRPDL